MSDDILNAIEKFFEFEYDIVYEFKVTYGLTFAFKTTTTIFKGKVTSVEIEPVGIIYEENGEYYLAPLGKADNIHEIVKEYVNKFMQVEEECLPFQQ